MKFDIREGTGAWLEAQGRSRAVGVANNRERLDGFTVRAAKTLALVRKPTRSGTLVRSYGSNPSLTRSIP